MPAGIDTDDFEMSILERRDTTKIKLIYFGSLYDNMDDHLEFLSKALTGMTVDYQLDIFSSQRNYADIFKEHGLEEKVVYHDQISTKELFRKVVQSDFVLLFKPYEYGKDNISTKYFEIINSRVPIILIGESGEASEYIEKNMLGSYFHPKAQPVDLTEILNSGQFQGFNNKMDISKYTFEYLGKKLIRDLLD